MNDPYEMFENLFKGKKEKPETIIEKVRSGKMHWAWGGRRGIEPCNCDKKSPHLLR